MGGGGDKRESAAVADSIRHAGLQCKLLHGRRCDFYERVTGFSEGRGPCNPKSTLETKPKGERGGRGFFQ